MTERQFARFMSLVDAQPSGCWVWRGTRGHHEYGRICLGPYRRGARKPAHRVSYEYFIGSIPEGYVIDHLCRNHPCVNPTHLEAVTCKTNVQRGQVGRYARTAEHNAKIAASKRGKPRPWTPEWRAKLAESMRRTWQRKKELAA